MRKLILIIFCVVTLSLFGGRYAGDFMAIGSGVKSLGMGGAFVAVADDGSAIFWNSAGVSNIKQTEVSMMRAFLYDDLATYDFLSFCQPLPNNVTIGASWTRLTIDEIPHFSESHLVGTVDFRIANPAFQLSGNPDDEFKSTDDLLQFAFSKRKDIEVNLGWMFFELPIQTNYGVNVKYIKREIYENLGTGIGFDAGFRFRTSMAALFDVDWMGDMAIGANFQNINNTVIKWDTESDHEDEVVFTSKVGYAIFQDLPWYDLSFVFAWDVDYSYDNVHHYGMELKYLDFASIRGGFYEDNWSGGLSVHFMNFTVDYAFVQNSNIEKHTNRVGLKYKF